MHRRRFLCCLGCGGAAALTGCALTQRRHAAAPRPEDFAYCGVDCTACDVYKATVHGDEAARTRAIEPWAKTAHEHWGMKTLGPAILVCKGCRTEGKDIFKGCRLCPIRGCVRKRRLASCALCADRHTCTRLAPLLADCPEAKANLANVAAAAK